MDVKRNAYPKLGQGPNTVLQLIAGFNIKTRSPHIDDVSQHQAVDDCVDFAQAFVSLWLEIRVIDLEVVGDLICVCFREVLFQVGGRGLLNEGALPAFSTCADRKQQARKAVRIPKIDAVKLLHFTWDLAVVKLD